jgi:serine/threonine-protein kinase
VSDTGAPLVRIGRYCLYDAIASGGMAVVHLGRFVGGGGFSRTVAIKRLHPHLATDPELVTMLLDEARLVERVRDPHVVPVFDVVVEKREVCLVLEYVHGESLSRLLTQARQSGEKVPPPIALAVVCGALRGLAAAHGATAEDGTALALVHRDVSPQNILVGVDGVARVIDFGVAKATARLQQTHDGQVKGKFGYMAPEQLTLGAIDARTDLFAVGVVLWELLVGERLFDDTDLASVMKRVELAGVDPPSMHAIGIGPAVDAVVARALSPKREGRFPSAIAMAQALEESAFVASQDEVAQWVRRIAGDELALRQARVAAVENGGAAEAGTAASELPTAATRPVSASAAAPTDGRRPRRLGVPGFVTLVVLGAAVLVGAGFGTKIARSRAARVTGASATSAAQAAEPPAAPASASVVAAPPPLAAASADPPSASSSAAAATSVAVRPRPPVSQRPRPAASRVPSYCSQRKLAFTVGPDGIERPRPECL